MIEINKIREDFPILSKKINDKPLVYLDNAATTLKPQAVLNAIMNYYSNETANVHRGIHYLSVQATDKYEAARKTIANFISAKNEEVVYTRGTTESVNLISLGFMQHKLKPGDKIVCTQMDHHSNMVPWQMLAQDKGLEIAYIPVLDDGSLDIEAAKKIIDTKTKLLTFNYVSNATGIINPVTDLVNMARDVGAYVAIDAAQAVLHFPIDVKQIDCDFLSFSSHKLLGPTGLGIMYSKYEHLEEMKPIYGGGDMIDRVSLEGYTLNQIPFRFEAGTPHIAGAIGLGAAISYIQDVGLNNIQEYELHLKTYVEAKLQEIEGLEIMGTAKNKVPVYSFSVAGLHGTDIASILDQEGVAVRSGHHCTMPLLQRFHYNSLARASFSFYNTTEEVDVFIAAVKKSIEFLG